MSSSNNATGGIGCGGLTAVLLGVLFIGLKLGHVIDWPWVWVLAPFWIYAGLIALVLFIVLIVFLIVLLAMDKK